MSERDFLRMTDQEVDALLEECRRMQVGTLNADGSVHLVPMSYMRFDGHLAFWTDPSSKKVKNLRRDPRITCLIETGTDFAEFRAVQLTGQAEVIDDLDTSVRAGEALTGRYTPLDEPTKAYVAGLAPQRVTVVVKPDRVVSWDHRKMAGVRPDKIGS